MSVVVQDIAPYVQYVATPNQTAFPFPYLVFPPVAPGDISVYKRPAGSVANDNANILILTTNYTVTLSNPPAVGGTVTLNVGATVGDIVTIVRNMPDNRLNNYLDGGLWSATQFNTDFDRTVLMAQQNKMYNITITPHYNVNDVINTASNALTSGVDLFFPVLPPNCVWMKNAANTQIVAVPLAPAAGGGAPVVLPTALDSIPFFNNTAGMLQSSTMTFDAINNILQLNILEAFGSVRLMSNNGINFTTLTVPNGMVANIALALPGVLPTFANMPLVGGLAGSIVFDNNGVTEVTGTPTNAQLLNLFTAPIQVIAAPAAGFVVLIHHFTIEHVFAGGAFTVPGGAVFQLQYNNTGNAGGPIASSTIAAAGIFDQAASFFGLTASGVAARAVATSAAQPICITNTVGNMTVGGGTARYKVVYSYMAV
ncbi:MAG TPA: hypothetical protein VNX68_12950 [Nitrosopumilaceae archaeon]|nr:hypothetical protein [Nitrosopumilaceae archaeon]